MILGIPNAKSLFSDRNYFQKAEYWRLQCPQSHFRLVGWRFCIPADVHNGLQLQYVLLILMNACHNNIPPSFPDDFTGLYGNFTKLGLAVFSIFFDILFVMQQSYLYRILSYAWNYDYAIENHLIKSFIHFQVWRKGLEEMQSVCSWNFDFYFI